MAHVQKNTASASGNLFNHYGRDAESEKYKYLYRENKNIDPERTYLNYNLAANQQMTQEEILHKRLSEVKVLKRKDVNVMCSWVLTVPKEVPEEHQEEFFQKSYQFLENRYGKENVISAYVHLDETTPHMHFAFVPVVLDKKKNIEKLSAKECINRQELKIFHTDLQNFLEEKFVRDRDFDCNVLNGATESGNKTITQLKTETMQEMVDEMVEMFNEESSLVTTLQCEKESLENETQELENQLNTLVSDIKVLKGQKTLLQDEIEVLDKARQDKSQPPKEMSLNEWENKIKMVRDDDKKNSRVALLEKFVSLPNVKPAFEHFVEMVKSRSHVKSNDERTK